MYLLKMLPAGVPVQILFRSDISQEFRERVVASWGSLDPELTETDTPDTSLPTIVLGAVPQHEAIDLPAEFSIYMEVAAGREDHVLERLTVEVTLRMLEQLSGKATLFHAAALGHPDTKAAMVLIGPSGRGKTTASRFLGQHFLYLSDETSVIDEDYRMRPYPKPLSVISDQAQPKQQIDPRQEGIITLSPLDHSMRIAHMILLNRQPGIAEPYFERVPLADALLSMVTETSGLDVSYEGLSKLNQLVKHCGGVLRINYTEISSTLPLFNALLTEGKAAVLTDEAQEWEAEEIILDHAHEGESLKYPAQVARGRNTSVLVIGERALMTSGRQLIEPSPLALDIWYRLEEENMLDDLKKELVADYGEVDDETYRQFMISLKETGILQ